MHVIDLFNNNDRKFLEGIINNEADVIKFPNKKTVRSIGPKNPTDGEVVSLKTGPKKQTISTKELAMISDRALDKAYNYGLSVPGPNFGWLANMNSAMFAKRAIDSGETNIDHIAAEVHKGWAAAAIGDYKNRLPIDPPTPHETKLRRLRLAQVEYNNLPEKEKEKDRVVARALLQAITAKEIPGGSDDIAEGDVVPMQPRPRSEPVVNVQPAAVVPFSQFRDPGTRRLEMWKQKVRDSYPEYGNKIRFVSKDNGRVVSAEMPGVDRSFGVFDLASEKGQVLDEDLRDPKDNPCWKGYHPVGTKKKNGRTVPNCVPKANEAANPAQQAAIAIAKKKKEQGVAEGTESQSDYDARMRRLAAQYDTMSDDKKASLDKIPGRAEQFQQAVDYVKKHSKNNQPGVAESTGDGIKAAFGSMAAGFDSSRLNKAIVYFMQGRHQEGEQFMRFALRGASPEVQAKIVSQLKSLPPVKPGIDPNTDPTAQAYITNKVMPWIKNQLNQGVAEDQLDEISLGDYERKAGMGKALAQMGAAFAPDAERRAKELAIAKKRGKGLERAKVRSDRQRAEAEKKSREASLAKDREDLPQMKAKLQDLEAKLDPNFEYSDDHSFWRQQKDLQGQIQHLKDRIKRAEQDVTEGAEDDPVAQAIIRRILTQKPDLLKYGADLVGDAIDEVASFVGQVDEIGTSDVSAWVAQVERIVKQHGMAEDQLNEVSDEMLINYLTKVHQDAMKHSADPTKRSAEKRNKSVAGFNRAFNKLDARRDAQSDVAQAQALAPRVSEEGENKKFDPMDHQEYIKQSEELHRQYMLASQRNDKESMAQLRAERDALDALARKGLKEAETEGRPRIRKYSKLRPDGTKAVRYEVLDYRGMRIPGQGIEGFDDLKYAKEFYHRNYDKLQGPVEEQVQEEPIREVAGRYWCKNEKRWKNVE